MRGHIGVHQNHPGIGDRSANVPGRGAHVGGLRMAVEANWLYERNEFGAGWIWCGVCSVRVADEHLVGAADRSAAGCCGWTVWVFDGVVCK